MNKKELMPAYKIMIRLINNIRRVKLYRFS